MHDTDQSVLFDCGHRLQFNIPNAITKLQPDWV